MTTNQEGVHAAIRAVTGTSRSYNEDWHALFDDDGISSGTFNERMLAWINATLGTSYTNVNEAMQAFAVDQGFTNWASMNTFTVGYTFLNAEAESVVSAFSVAPDNTRKALIDDTVGDLKTAGVWSKLDAMYVCAAHDDQGSRVDWLLPSRVAVGVNSPTFVADRGWTGDGATSRLRTNYTPSTDAVVATADDASIWVWVRTGSVENVAAAGSVTFGFRNSISPRTTALRIQSSINNGTTNSLNTHSTSTGMFGSQRISGASTMRNFINGANVGDATGVTYGSLVTYEQWICGGNSTGFSARQVAMAAWGGSLTDTQAADFFTIMNAYMTAIGAA